MRKTAAGREKQRQTERDEREGRDRVQETNGVRETAAGRERNKERMKEIVRLPVRSDGFGLIWAQCK